MPPAPPSNAPSWVITLYWVMVAGGLGLALVAWVLVRVRNDLVRLRSTAHDLQNTTSAAAGQAELSTRIAREIRASLNGGFDERMQQNIRAVLADPASGQMFVAAFRLVSRMEAEQIAAQAAEMAVTSHERREHEARAAADRGGRRSGDNNADSL